METTLISANNEENLPSGQLALPFNEKQFGDFLVSLLGKPQTITKRFVGSFCIDKDSIVNIFQIIEQRIHQQNDAKLISFRSLITYNDNSTVELSGFEHLVNFNEPLPLIPKGIDLTWQYLIKFKDKEIQEKQEINISFNVGAGFRSLGNNIIFDFGHFRTNVSLRISHTARTWGADMEALLSKHIEVLCKPSTGYKKILNKDPEVIQKTIQILIFLTSLICSILWINRLKVSLLIFLFVGTYLFSAIVQLILEYVEPIDEPSFILLTKESYNDKDRTIKKHKIRWTKFFTTVILSLILGIVANYIYAYLTK
jgi:hypothetical protein